MKKDEMKKDKKSGGSDPAEVILVTTADANQRRKEACD